MLHSSPDRYIDHPAYQFVYISQVGLGLHHTNEINAGVTETLSGTSINARTSQTRMILVAATRPFTVSLQTSCYYIQNLFWNASSETYSTPHPRNNASVRIISKHFIYPCIKRDVRLSVVNHLNWQCSNIHLSIKSSLKLSQILTHVLATFTLICLVL